jgi:hypothetical protein
LSDLDARFDPWALTARLESVPWADGLLRVGDRVLLRPQGRADILDLELAGRRAVVEAIEQDFDDQVHVAVVLEDDPGQDLGRLRQPGHRFFFRVSELEPVGSEAGR